MMIIVIAFPSVDLLVFHATLISPREQLAKAASFRLEFALKSSWIFHYTTFKLYWNFHYINYIFHNMILMVDRIILGFGSILLIYKGIYASPRFCKLQCMDQLLIWLLFKCSWLWWKEWGFFNCDISKVPFIHSEKPRSGFSSMALLFPRLQCGTDSRWLCSG